MKRVAIFVDAGHLFAEGSKVLTGEKERRRDLRLRDPRAVLAKLREVAAERSNGRPLLRVYWYDGAAGGRLSIEQELLANLDDVKIRLGSINQVQEQKEVDSLIVTDLMELARVGAICDAVLLSGDADLRVGVVYAQSYGVRVHLLGIDNPESDSQAKSLRQECDTTTKWSEDIVREFLEVRVAPVKITAVDATAFVPGTLEEVVKETVDALDDTDVEVLVEYFDQVNYGSPPEYDRPLLAASTKKLGRQLTLEEKKHMRASFRKAVRAKSDA